MKDSPGEGARSVLSLPSSTAETKMARCWLGLAYCTSGCIRGVARCHFPSKAWDKITSDDIPVFSCPEHASNIGKHFPCFMLQLSPRKPQIFGGFGADASDIFLTM